MRFLLPSFPGFDRAKVYIELGVSIIKLRSMEISNFCKAILFLLLVFPPFFPAVLGVEPNVSCMLDKYSTTELQPQPFFKF